jgi:hypothetical protein
MFAGQQELASFLQSELLLILKGTEARHIEKMAILSDDMGWANGTTFDISGGQLL